jgi:hypothetical protein
MEGTSVTSIEVSWNRILDSNVNALCQCPPVPDENREAMRTTSMMRDCNASALTPARKSSNGVLLSRLKSIQLAALIRGELFLIN